MTTGSGIAIGMCGLGAWLATVGSQVVGDTSSAVVFSVFAFALSCRAFLSPAGKQEKGVTEAAGYRPTNPPRAK